METVPLVEAAADGDVERVVDLIAAGADLEGHAWSRGTPLVAATLAGHVDVVRLLVASGANVNANTPWCSTPMCHAASVSAEMVRELAALGADPNGGGGDTHTPLHSAETLETVRALVELGADIHAEDGPLMTPLTHCDPDGEGPEIAEYLLSLGAEWNLPAAIGMRRMDVLRELLAAGHDPNVRCGRVDGRPIHQAIQDGNVEAVEALLDAGADADATGRLLDTPLQTSIVAEQLDITKLLLERGADPNAPSERGVTPLGHIWAWYVDDAFRMLLDHGADPNVPIDGESVLAAMCREGSPKLALLLLEHGADPNARSEYGTSALEHAMAMQFTDVVAELIRRGAMVGDPPVPAAECWGVGTWGR